jgi:hypothetical protein
MKLDQTEMLGFRTRSSERTRCCAQRALVPRESRCRGTRARGWGIGNAAESVPRT